jgi:hypothetical protein
VCLLGSMGAINWRPSWLGAARSTSAATPILACPQAD